MKKSYFFLLAIFCDTIIAKQYTVQAVVKDVRIVSKCQNSSKSSIDPIIGATLGGVIGKQFGSGKGKDVMTVLGAVMGSRHFSKKESRSKCDSQKYYEIFFEWNDVRGSITTKKEYRIGEFISVRIDLQNRNHYRQNLSRRQIVKILERIQFDLENDFPQYALRRIKKLKRYFDR